YFLDAATFLKRVQAGNFLEHATVYGNSYGTLKSEVVGKLRQVKDVVLNIDVQGAAAIRAKAEEDAELRAALITVVLTPRSLAILEKRLRKRGADSETGIQKRLSVARQEIIKVPPLHDFLARHAQTFLNPRFRICAPLSQTFLQNRERRRRQKNRDQRRSQLRIFFGLRPDCRRSLHIDVQH